MQDQYTVSFNLSKIIFKITIQQYVQSQEHVLAMMKMTLGTRKFHLLVTKFCLNLTKVERKGEALQWYIKPY